MTYATYTDAVQRMDAKVGEILAQLKADGLADDTIVVYCSDHGGVLPRSNCLLYTSPSPRDATLSRMPSSA